MRLLALLVFLLAAGPAAAQTPGQSPGQSPGQPPGTAPPPAEAEIAYLVKRNGEPIGTLVMKVRHEGPRTTVESHYGIQIRLMSIVLYHYDKHMAETYESGRLVAYRADIDDNGTKSGVQAARDGDKLSVTHPTGRLVVPLGLLPETYWQKATVKQTRLIDSSDGTLLNVQVSDPVREEIRVDGRTLKADRYTMTGDLKRELWYGAARGDWLKMRMTASDGSIIEILRDWPPLWKRGLL